jgi:hypothetical protein
VLPQEELEIVLFFALSWNVCRTAKKLAYNVPFTIVIPICYMASIQGNNSERCGYWFCKGDSFLDETFATAKLDSKLTNSLKEIDVLL